MRPPLILYQLDAESTGRFINFVETLSLLARILIVDIINIIKKLGSLECNINHPEIINNFLSQIHFQSIAFIYDINTTDKNVIVRSRNNCCQSDIDTKNAISYVPSHLCVQYQRASTPNQSCFYGSFMEADLYEHIIYVGLLNDEYFQAKKTAITSLLESGDYMHKEESTAVVGAFKIIQPLRLFAIPSPCLDDNKSDLFKIYSADYEQYYSQHNYPISIETMRQFHNFLYNQFNKECKTECDYMLPALIANRIFAIENFDGIIYESVKAKSKAILNNTLNIALKPTSVDEKLRLDFCMEYKHRIKAGEINIKDPIIFTI